MRRILLLFLFMPGFLFSQKASDSIDIKLSGFVRGDSWFETRQNYGACEELFTLYPKPEEYDADGNDINAESVSNMTAIASRLRTIITGPEILGAKSMAYAEADFTSNLGTDGFRFRHAFLQLKWNKAKLLFGRFWHPMFVTDAFPTVIALNTGAPFQVFNRSPQLRYTQRMNKFRIVSALVYQGDYASFGPDNGGKTSDADFMKNASYPEFNLRLEYLFNGNIFGVGGAYKRIQPRLKTEDVIGVSHETNETVSGSMIMSYMKITSGKFTYKYRVMLGQNVSEHLLFGGYAVSEYDPATGSEEYTPYKHLFTWGNILYGKKLRVGFFGGFAKNLGTTENISTALDNRIFARGAKIDYSYRIAPHVQYTIKNLNLSTELEYTAAAYGFVNPNEKGIVEESEEVSNLRLLLTATYNF